MPTCIIVCLSRRGDSEYANQPWHDNAGRATRFPGCPSGGVVMLPPASGQVNVQSSNYWSATEFDSSNAWNFNFNNGNQNTNDKSNNNYAWAVRPGE